MSGEWNVDVEWLWQVDVESVDVGRHSTHDTARSAVRPLGLHLPGFWVPPGWLNGRCELAWGELLPDALCYKQTWL